MEIIRDGNPETLAKVLKRRVQFACQYCGCIWIADGREYDEDQSAYGRTYYCKCPYCGKTVKAYNLTIN